MSGSGRRCVAISAGLILLSVLSGCGVFRLGNDLEILYDEVAIISGDLEVDAGLIGQPIVLLTRPLRDARPPSDSGEADMPPTHELVDYRFADAQNRYNFQARPGDYRQMAFLDQNGDFT